MKINNRLLYLDNLKVCLTVLVIFHHAGQAYGDGGDWAYHPSNPAEFMPWIWHFFSVNAAFFMGLFFLISGYFVPTSFDKQGAKVFVKKKLIRLGIPLLVIIRKIRRKIRNFKEDVKSGGFGEATMSRLEDHFDRKNKK